VPIYNQAGAVLRVTNVTSTVNWFVGLPFHNEGALEIWQGILDMQGDYSPGGSSSLKFGMRGTTPGTDCGQLVVDGKLALTGQLQVQLIDGFTPALDDLFPVISASSRSGEFDTFLGGVLGNRLYLDPVYQPTGVTLRVRDDRPLLASGPPRLENGDFKFLLNGAIGATYGFVTATNFTDWETLDVTVTLPKATAFVTHTNAGTEPMRFYRAFVILEP
jgi:hypothetical protein